MAERSAVVRIQDKQIRVHEKDVIEVPLLQDEVGANIEIADVLMLNGDDVKVGTPTVEGAKVTAKVVEHGRGPKIRIFKFKRRKTYRKSMGHRQDFTKIEIVSIEG